MKHKIAKKYYYEYQCEDRCCDESGYEWYVDGEFVHRSPCEDNGWLEVLRKLGIEVQLVGMNEDRHMTRDQLLKDYAAIIDEQKKEIKELQEQLNKHNARVHKLTLEEWITFDQS